jgi:hypothetical protein
MLNVIAFKVKLRDDGVFLSIVYQIKSLRFVCAQEVFRILNGFIF